MSDAIHFPAHTTNRTTTHASAHATRLLGKSMAAIIAAGMLAEKLLHEERVAVVPGRSFGDAGIGFVRCSYATDYHSLEIALDRIEAFLKEFVDRKDAADHAAGANLDAHAFEIVDLGFDDGLGQSELRNAVNKHAASLVQGLKNRHAMSALDQVAGNG